MKDDESEMANDGNIGCGGTDYANDESVSFA
jgi:hypothetical protein